MVAMHFTNLYDIYPYKCIIKTFMSQLNCHIYYLGVGFNTKTCFTQKKQTKYCIFEKLKI